MRFARLALAAGLAGFLLAAAAGHAQAPPAVPPVPDQARITTYNVTSPTSVFNVGFPVYGDCTDLLVTQNGQAASLGSDYACQSASGRALGAIARPITDLQVIFNTPVASGPVVIQSNWRPRNVTSPTAPGITRTEFERTINQIISGMRDLQQQQALYSPAPAIYGAWNPTYVYPPNSVVTYGNQMWQALQSNVDQQPAAGSVYWTVVTNPPNQVTINNFQLPGQPAAIAGASTVDLGTLINHFAQITGSQATITSFGSSCSPALPLYWATFTGANTIVYNSTSMILPTGGANITTNPGDQAVLECLGNGNWQVISYTPITGLLPSSAVVAFNASVCPAGWVASDGSNGTNDLRGVFVRGLDTTGTRDPGRTLGTYQNDTVGPVTFTVYINGLAQRSGTAGSGGASSLSSYYGQAFNTYNQQPAGTTETRPKNVALLYCQKQ